MNGMNLKPRSRIDCKYTWNAESVFSTRAEWRAEAEALRKDIPVLAAKAGSVRSRGARGLAELHKLMTSLMDRVLKLYTYASMSQAVDTGDEEAQGFVGVAGGILGQFMSAAAFMDPELIAVGEAEVLSWIEGDEDLTTLRHYADDLFRRQEHVRSAEVEELLGSAFEVFLSVDNVRSLLVDQDIKFEPACDGSEVAQGSVESLLASPDRDLRRSAWRNYCDSHIAHEHTLAANLATALKRDVFVARARRFDNSLEAALFEQNIPREVFDSTLGTFKKNLPVWHRYWDVRRRALGVERLRHEDIWAPIAKDQPVVPYEKAVGWICDAMEPLGDGYVSALRRGCLEERWVDVYPTEGKGQGAFSCGSPGTRPFIMMSYSDDLSSVSTLAHELGHSMHTWYTCRRQPSIYAQYGIFVAEVASNFNQAMVRASLFEREKDPQFQIALVEEAFENLHRYFFIMPTLARFELEMHSRVERGMSVTASDMNECMADLFQEGYGPGFEMDRHREGSTWAQFSHLYMNYYVFQYATGISAAHALAGPILAGDGVAASRYLDFLSAGRSVYPVDALMAAGVDMRGPAAVEKGFEVVSGLIDRLERLIAT